MNHIIKPKITNITTISENSVSYINVDSSQRNSVTTNTYSELITLPPYPLEFTNGSSKVRIYLPNHNYQENDQIILSNVVSKYVILNNVLQVKKNSNYMKIHHVAHGLSFYGLYNSSDPNQFIPVEYIDDLPVSFAENEDIPDSNQHYILKKNGKMNISIQLSNAKGMDFNRTMIGNIPTNFINKKHQVYLIFTKTNNLFIHNPDYYLIKLQKKSSINYEDSKNFIQDRTGLPTKIPANNTIHIGFNNLFGVPLNLLNTKTSANDNMENPYLTVIDTTDNTFSVDVGYNAVVDPYNNFYNYNDLENDGTDVSKNANMGGGPQVFVRGIINTNNGDSAPNQYKYKLDRTYKNVIQAKIVASIFPNSQRVINNIDTDIVNNRLYWRNLSDGDQIYYLEITPGNYTSQELAENIEKEFSRTLRYPYSIEYQSDIHPDAIKYPTAINSEKYSENGLYKYHIVEVSISEITDMVSLSSYRQIFLHDKIGPGPISQRVLIVPDQEIEFTMADNIQTDIGVHGSNIVDFEYMPFDPVTEKLFIYFTPNTQSRITETYPYAYFNLYEYVSNIPDGKPKTGYNTFRANMNPNQQILINFHRTKMIYPEISSIQEISNINTTTQLKNFHYDYLTNIVTMPNHKLRKGAIIITDQFPDLMNNNNVYIYEIKNIIDVDKFIVTKIPNGTKFKFIYDSLIINFSGTDNGMIHWLDQIDKNDVIISLPPPRIDNNSTISFVMIHPLPTGKNILRVHHPAHNLNIGDEIKISDSGQINQVPAIVINNAHKINKIVDADNYEVVLGNYSAEAPKQPFEHINSIVIKFPDVFQLLFNRKDTLGNMLNFRDVGNATSVTPYLHQIKNSNPYINDDYFENNLQNIPVGKLNLNGPTYFYICIEELGNYHNTKPVANVFTIGRWTDDPGTIVFDSVVPTPRIFNPPLTALNELNISIYHPNGNLVEFNGIDHQFVLEIVESRDTIS